MERMETSFFSSGKRLSARLHLPSINDKCPGVILNHGYSGCKDEYDDMAEFLCSRGFVVLQFDSSGSGMSDGTRGNLLCSTDWIEDACNAVSFISSFSEVDQSRLGYAGSSIGGAVTLWVSAIDSRIKCSFVMAPAGDGRRILKDNWLKNRGEQSYRRFIDEIESDLLNTVSGGVSARVSVPYALGFSEKDEKEFLSEREGNPNLISEVTLYSIANSFINFKSLNICRDISIPVMVIHGDSDEVVSIEQSYEIKKRLNDMSEFVIIKGAGHSLPTEAQSNLIFEYAAKWFNEYL